MLAEGFSTHSSDDNRVRNSRNLLIRPSLTQIDGELEKALAVFRWLSAASDKPEAYFVKYSLALLKANSPAESLRVVLRGLAQFPDDIGLMGNHTIALRQMGRLEEAKNSALRRLDLRRDAQSLGEASSVFLSIAEYERDRDLSQAISAAKNSGTLLAEGLAIQPNMEVLWANLIRLRRFANQSGEAAAVCQQLYNSTTIGRFYRELAVCELLARIIHEVTEQAFVA